VVRQGDRIRQVDCVHARRRRPDGAAAGGPHPGRGPTHGGVRRPHRSHSAPSRRAHRVRALQGVVPPMPYLD
jgi:hypothetical protein